MYEPVFYKLAEDLVDLFCQGYQLERAIAIMAESYALVMSRYMLLHPDVVGNHLVNFHTRMACVFAFCRGDEGYIPTTIKKPMANAALVTTSLAYGYLDNAEFAPRIADAEIKNAILYLEQLQDAVDAHVKIELYLRSKRMLEEKTWEDVQSQLLTAYQMQDIVQPDGDVRRMRSTLLRKKLQKRVDKAAP